ncbi:arginine--tRNA ligase [bacterium]|nr:arginine--tRNA ligase [bacterium]
MKLFQEIQGVIEKAFPALEGSEFDFQPAPENQPGDFGLACFRFSKALGEAPPKIAVKLSSLEYPGIFREAKAVGPYLNFTLDRNSYATGLIGEIIERKGTFGSTGEGTGKTVLLEHTSINPNASPHIGRSRNGLIGDTLARLYRFEGYDVDVHYYVNDMGKQIALLVLQIGDRTDLEFHEVLDLYVEANRRAEKDPEFEAKGLDLLMRMEEGDPSVAEAFTGIVDICLRGQLDVLGRLGLRYDTFDRESSFLRDPRMERAMEVFAEKGALFTDDQERAVLDLQKLGYDREEGRYIVLKRANGSTMYMYRDIAYTLEKIGRSGDRNIVVLGEDHTMYFEQMETIIRALGKTPPEVVHYSYILLREGKMSTRQGNVVLLEDFLDEAIRHAREKVDEQWPGIPESERGEIARIIGIGAVRYAILSVRPNRNVIFDWDTALSFSGDTGPYIQYSCTRVASILRKHGSEPERVSSPLTVTHDAEWGLVFRLAFVTRDIAAALETRNPAILATTALDVARRFSIFYNTCPVLAAENDTIRESRIAFCVATRQVLMNLLGLIGIEAPERM